MSLVTFTVNVSTGYRLREGARPIPCGKTFEIEPTMALVCDVGRGWLLAEIPDPTIEEVSETFASEVGDVEVFADPPKRRRKRSKARV